MLGSRGSAPAPRLPPGNARCYDWVCAGSRTRSSPANSATVVSGEHLRPATRSAAVGGLGTGTASHVGDRLHRTRPRLLALQLTIVCRHQGWLRPSIASEGQQRYVRSRRSGDSNNRNPGLSEHRNEHAVVIAAWPWRLPKPTSSARAQRNRRARPARRRRPVPLPGAARRRSAVWLGQAGTDRSWWGRMRPNRGTVSLRRQLHECETPPIYNDPRCNRSSGFIGEPSRQQRQGGR